VVFQLLLPRSHHILGQDLQYLHRGCCSPLENVAGSNITYLEEVARFSMNSSVV